MIAFLLVFAGLLALLSISEVMAERHDLKKYRAPGNLIAIDSKRRLHVVEQGKQNSLASPVVVLEAGLAATSLSWLFTPPRLAEFARVISYDRSGLGQSSRATQLPTVDNLLADLNVLITQLGVTAPLILVGHSFGGLIVRAFAHRYPDRVAGLVLVDPVSLITYANPDRQHRRRLRIAVRLSRRGGLMARLAIVRTALWLVAHGSRKLPAFVARISAGKGSSVMDRLAGEIRKLPPETHGPIRAHWSRPKSFILMAEYLRLLPAAASQALHMPVPAHIPMIVLSAASATHAELAERDSWVQSNPASWHKQIPNTTHWLQLDRPDLVVEAVRELMPQLAGKIG